jgi:hypothetical protein
MALERFRSTPSLRKILTRKGLPTGTVIRENPHLRPGHLPHDNFVESLLDWFQKESDGGLMESKLLGEYYSIPLGCNNYLRFDIS